MEWIGRRGSEGGREEETEKLMISGRRTRQLSAGMSEAAADLIRSHRRARSLSSLELRYRVIYMTELILFILTPKKN